LRLDDAQRGSELRRIRIPHEIRQRDLAAMAGIARENGSRIMSDWKRRKLVDLEAHYFCINDPVGLRSELTRLAEAAARMVTAAVRSVRSGWQGTPKQWQVPGERRDPDRSSAPAR